MPHKPDERGKSQDRTMKKKLTAPPKNFLFCTAWGLFTLTRQFSGGRTRTRGALCLLPRLPEGICGHVGRLVRCEPAGGGRGGVSRESPFLTPAWLTPACRAGRRIRPQTLRLAAVRKPWPGQRRAPGQRLGGGSQRGQKGPSLASLPGGGRPLPLLKCCSGCRR